MWVRVLRLVASRRLSHGMTRVRVQPTTTRVPGAVPPPGATESLFRGDARSQSVWRSIIGQAGAVSAPRRALILAPMTLELRPVVKRLGARPAQVDGIKVFRAQ